MFSGNLNKYFTIPKLLFEIKAQCIIAVYTLFWLMTTVSNLQLQSRKHLWDLNEEASSYLQLYDEEK